MKKVIAVIGCGRIANIAHFPSFSHMDNIRVKYACDLILEKAEKAKSDFPFIENAITDYHIALEDPEVDGIFVLTPNYVHYTVTMDALRAGKHVFCEKPITVSYELSQQMKKEADKQNKMLQIGVCNRYQRSVEKLAEMNRNGEFGNIYHVNCIFRSFRAIPGLGGAFTDKKQSGGGVLIDWGIHFLDLILYILGDAKLINVTCDAYSEMAKNMADYKYINMWAEDTSDIQNGVNDVEDYISGYVRTNKASISFNGAWAQNINHEEKYIDFLGDKKGARLNYCKLFELYDGDTLETISPQYELPDMYQSEDKAFIESMETGIKNRSNIDYVLESAKLLDTLYRSSEVKHEINL